MSPREVHVSVGSWRWLSGMFGRPTLLAVLTIGLALCATLVPGSPVTRTASAEVPKQATPLAAAERLINAFNRHDADAMALLVTSDFELYYVNQKGVASLSARGPEQLARDMAIYFGQRPSVQSSIVGAIDGPTYVSFRERIVGGQSSLAVYEVRGGLIRRAWYFPAED